MWQQHDILHGLQFVRHVRLVGEHVEACRENGAGFQRRDQRRLVDDGAARDVDQDAARTERLQHVGIDHLGGGGAAGHDHDQRVHRLSPFPSGRDSACRTRPTTGCASDRTPARARPQAGARSPGRCGPCRRSRSCGRAASRRSTDSSGSATGRSADSGRP